jgi:hypothetical protein
VIAKRFVDSNTGRESGDLVVRAGRHGDAKAVDWLKRQNFPLGGDPKALNFALSGDLTLTAKGASVVPVKGQLLGRYTGSLICKNVAFAQGHDAANNWWIYSNLQWEENKGGLSDRNRIDLTIECDGDDGKEYAVQLQDLDNVAFELGDIQLKK